MKTGELLKVSRFNYSCEDKDGNLLMCNFARGKNSFSKILKDDIEKYQKIILEDNITFDENKDYINELYNRGYLISQDTDEDLTVKSLYYDSIMSNNLSLTILPTEQCNFRCKYCYESFEKGKMTKEAQNSLLKFIQKRLSSSTGLSIGWFGGEPLEAFDVVEYIMENVKRMCLNKKMIYSSHITTNAYNLDAKTFDNLYKLKVYKYQITLDGLKEQHDQQRVKADGSGTFDKILENLLYIKNNPHYKLVNITIRVNITADILNNWDGFWNFYKSTFGNDIRFNIMVGPAGDYGGENVKLIKDKLINISDIHNKLELNGAYEDNAFIYGIERSFIPMDSICYASRKNSFIIGSDLNIYKCSVHFDMEKNIIGRIIENGDAIIDSNFHNQWYIKNTEKPICKSCFYLPCCNGGGCTKKRNFDNTVNSECVSMAEKKRISNSMLYLSNKTEFKKINFGGMIDYI